MTADEAITQSIREGEIVRLFFTQKMALMLLEKCKHCKRHGKIYEFSGVDGDQEWHVHLSTI